MIMTITSPLLEKNGGHGHNIPFLRKGGDCDDHDHNKPSSGKERDGGNSHAIPSLRKGGECDDHDHDKPSSGKERDGGNSHTIHSLRKGGECDDHDHTKPFLEKTSWWSWSYHSLFKKRRRW